MSAALVKFHVGADGVTCYFCTDAATSFAEFEPYTTATHQKGFFLCADEECGSKAMARMLDLRSTFHGDSRQDVRFVNLTGGYNGAVCGAGDHGTGGS